MFEATKMKLSVDEERKNRFEVLTDLVGSYYIYMDGEKRHSRISDTIFWGAMNTIASDNSIVGKAHPEHVVPLSFLFDKCFELIRKVEVGACSDNVAKRRLQWQSNGVREAIRKILIKNLIVVNIPKELANELDSKNYSLKTSMTDTDKEWEFGDCVFSRLEVVYKDSIKIAKLREIYRDYLLEYQL